MFWILLVGVHELTNHWSASWSPDDDATGCERKPIWFRSSDAGVRVPRRDCLHNAFHRVGNIFNRGIYRHLERVVMSLPFGESLESLWPDPQQPQDRVKE